MCGILACLWCSDDSTVKRIRRMIEDVAGNNFPIPSFELNMNSRSFYTCTKSMENFVDMLDGIFSFVLLDTPSEYKAMHEDCQHFERFQPGTWPCTPARSKVFADGRKRSCRFLGTVHHEIHFTPQDGIDVIEDVIYHTESDEVATVRSSVPTYLITWN
ncbi:hypothetical protein K1719_010883 [Acacia pycnantha]|nr:hypothetical protein K1719_010883 [Acacia pycnantha]